MIMTIMLMMMIMMITTYEPDGNDDDNDYSEKDLKEELLCPLHNIGPAQGAKLHFTGTERNSIINY